jgi:hypothetical protein
LLNGKRVGLNLNGFNMQKLKLEYFDDLSVGVRIVYGKDFLEFEDMPYECRDASSVIKLLAFLINRDLIEISCKDKKVLKWIEEQRECDKFRNKLINEH